MASKLYVGNLNYATTEDSLRNAFSTYGEVISVKIIQGKGFGFVEFKSDSEAGTAKEALNNTQIDGRPIKVSDARPQEKKPYGGGEKKFYGGGNRGDYGGGGNRGGGGGYNKGNRDRY
ncbi:MAG: hypothetical protein HY22_02850 [[Candidatus Thermochlorobacteriaceae] bacterium GBChlB]|nr:MAG: hypothetical protein HY22_02850 [[Candidatus Thermochlorobacteriaceae] bacterium GBChlB]